MSLIGHAASAQFPFPLNGLARWLFAVGWSDSLAVIRRVVRLRPPDRFA
jgi:hypothetical protein